MEGARVREREVKEVKKVKEVKEVMTKGKGWDEMEWDGMVWNGQNQPHTQ